MVSTIKLKTDMRTSENGNQPKNEIPSLNGNSQNMQLSSFQNASQSSVNPASSMQQRDAIQRSRINID